MAATRLRVEGEASDLPDAALVEAGGAGDRSALAELYRRHAGPAHRVARRVLSNDDDAADAVADAFTRVFDAVASRRAPAAAFRPYLLAAARNAAIDHLRRSDRLAPAGDMADHDQPAAAAGPPERLAADETSSLVAAAFRDLPARWQSVLWLTEVEGVPAREAAGMLGLSANNVSQLAVRARARLRERYLQAHVRNHAEARCQPTVDQLGAYVAGTLPGGARIRVDDHVAGCGSCRDRLDEVADLGTTLRRSLGPAPLAAALAGSRLRWRRGARSNSGGARRWPLRACPNPPPADAGLDTLAGAAAATDPAPTTVPAGAGAELGGGEATAVHVREAAQPLVDAVRSIPVSAMASVAAAGPAVRLAARWVVAVVVAVVPSLGGGTGGGGRSLAAPPPSLAVAATSPAPVPTTTTTVAPPADPGPAEPPPPAPPPPLPATAHPHTAVAQAVVPTVAVHDAPDPRSPARGLGNPQPSGAPLVFLVNAQAGDWVDVLLPTRPNGSRGWVAAADVTITEHDWSIVVELGAHRLTLFSGHDVSLVAPVGVGTSDTPTPGGLYYTKELIQPTDARGRLDPSGPYGPYAYGLSGFSDVLTSFGGGDGVIGIHGTNDPSALGHDVSHGCIRVSNAVITRMAGILPLGVPVEIRA
ncbi:MAG: sigma-70 family RNA polymerase sigma factor [Acidimicrobiales bacterium]